MQLKYLVHQKYFIHVCDLALLILDKKIKKYRQINFVKMIHVIILSFINDNIIIYQPFYLLH